MNCSLFAQSCRFSQNNADEGGVFYLMNASKASLETFEPIGNTAFRGTFVVSLDSKLRFSDANFEESFPRAVVIDDLANLEVYDVYFDCHYECELLDLYPEEPRHSDVFLQYWIALNVLFCMLVIIACACRRLKCVRMATRYLRGKGKHAQ
jgi:hypothetical protein